MIDDSMAHTDRIDQLLKQVKLIQAGEAEPPPVVILDDYEDEEAEDDDLDLGDEDEFGARRGQRCCRAHPPPAHLCLLSDADWLQAEGTPVS